MVPIKQKEVVMVKRLSAVLVAIMLLSFTAAAHAQDSVVDGMAAKFQRGVVNTFTGWVEFPMQIKKGYDEGFMDNEDQKLVGALVGIIDGFFHSIGRTTSGMLDLFGFWAANPADNDGVGLPLDAEYAWEEGTPYNIFEPDIMDGAVSPIGKKLMRGIGNGLLGIAELPGQVMKGMDEGDLGTGLVKGVWYWFSRSYEGMADLLTVINTDTADQVGPAFDEEWPWDALSESL
jgi:putative exosortase-associated protein (TIGR04073 family)